MIQNILFIICLIVSSACFRFGGYLEGKKEGIKIGYAEGYQDRIDYEHGR